MKQTLVEIKGPPGFVSWAEKNLDVASSSSAHVAIYLPTENLLNSLDELQDVLDEVGWITKDEKMDRDRYRITVARWKKNPSTLDDNPEVSMKKRLARRSTGGQHTRYIGDAAVRLEHYGRGEYEAEIWYGDRILWEAPLKVAKPIDPDDPEVIDRLAATAVHLAVTKSGKSRDIRSATSRAADAHGTYEVERGNPEGPPPGVPALPKKNPWEVHTGRPSWHQQRAGGISAAVGVYDKKEDAEKYVEGYKKHHPNEPVFIRERRENPTVFGKKNPNPEYQWFVSGYIRGSIKIFSGWEHKSDAFDDLRDNGSFYASKGAKDVGVRSRRTISMSGDESSPDEEHLWFKDKR